MVEVLGTGLNIEAIAGDIGEVAYNMSNNVASTLINVASRVGMYVWQGLMWLANTFKTLFYKALDLMKEFFKRYINLLNTNPLYFTIATVDLAIILNNSFGYMVRETLPITERPPVVYEGVKVQ